jgi:hypothetical protein
MMHASPRRHIIISIQFPKRHFDSQIYQPNTSVCECVCVLLFLLLLFVLTLMLLVMVMVVVWHISFVALFVSIVW